MGAGGGGGGGGGGGAGRVPPLVGVATARGPGLYPKNNFENLKNFFFFFPGNPTTHPPPPPPPSPIHFLAHCHDKVGVPQQKAHLSFESYLLRSLHGPMPARLHLLGR